MKRSALLTALGDAETWAQFPGWGQAGLVCQVKCVAAVLDATASDATTPDQRKEVADLITQHALKHVREEVFELMEHVCGGCRELTEALQRQCD